MVCFYNHQQPNICLIAIKTLLRSADLPNEVVEEYATTLISAGLRNVDKVNLLNYDMLVRLGVRMIDAAAIMEAVNGKGLLFCLEFSFPNSSLVKTDTAAVASQIASLEIKTEEEYATELYAPFPSPPLTCTEVDRLKDLLLTPPLRKLPLPIDLDITTAQSTLFERRNAKTPFMAIQFYHALNRCLPPPDSSEISWGGFYDCFIQETLQSNYSLLRGFTINRNMEDDSLTIDQKRRDLNVWFESTLIFCGEDKSIPTEINEAISDLRVKNKGILLLLL
jgi:hypothetical protein